MIYECTAHAKCPPGKYTKTAGSAASQTKCETCAKGFFKAAASSSSTKTDSCTAHTRCPPGRYTTKIGTATTQPQCEECAAGFYKAFASKNSSCIATDYGTFVWVP